MLYKRLITVSGYLKGWIALTLFKGLDISIAGHDNEKGGDGKPTIMLSDLRHSTGSKNG